MLKDSFKPVDSIDSRNLPPVKKEFNSNEINQALDRNKQDIFFNIEPETIYVWIDILGFSSLVDNSSKYEELSGLLDEFYRAFKEIKTPAECHRISDGIILKLNPEIRNPDTVKNFFLNIITIQNHFLLKNRYSRGGIAVGSKLISPLKKQYCENFYISNGLARAYNLESNSITWPVIGTDSSYLKKMCNMYGKEIRSFFSRTYSEDKEKIFYLNSYKNLNKNDQEQVYKNVLKNISNMENNPRVQHKYIWICRNLEKLNRKLTVIQCPKCQRKGR